MILFIILAFILFTLIAFAVLILGAGGATLMIVFSDVIVCAFIVFILMRFLFRKKRR